MAASKKWPSTSELFDDVADGLYQEDVRNKKDNVRRMLMKERQLIEDKTKAEKELAKIDKSLTETQEKIAKFKAWDWSVLAQFSSKPQAPAEPTPNN